MYKIIVTIFLTLFAASATKAQSVTRAVVVRGDTLPQFRLPEVAVLAKRRNARYYVRQRRHDARLVHNVRKALPYAKIAARKIAKIDRRLAAARSESERRRIVKEEYTDLMRRFKQPLTHLTVTQGKILVRLIYRETDNSAFAHIREYKGAFNAYFWQSIALLFGNNLKADYAPLGRDREIEEIVRMIERRNK